MNPSPGWYADPDDTAKVRYWDGSAWTERRAPATAKPLSKERLQSLEKKEALEDLRQKYSSVRTNRKKANLPTHLLNSLERNARNDELPSMIITGTHDSTEGSLIVFADRCVLSKSGIWGGYMAGSLGGAREATFFFPDITGIEYNSGLLFGVLEILTASYSGGATKDFWSGITNPDRNKSQNDPRTSSNTLPLPKDAYFAAKELIEDLRSMIASSKTTTVVIEGNSQSSSIGIADELEKLSRLRDSGILSDEEFAASKAKLLG
jgi:hypothetical protein